MGVPKEIQEAKHFYQHPKEWIAEEHEGDSTHKACRPSKLVSPREEGHSLVVRVALSLRIDVSSSATHFPRSNNKRYPSEEQDLHRHKMSLDHHENVARARAYVSQSQKRRIEKSYDSKEQKQQPEAGHADANPTSRQGKYRQRRVVCPACVRAAHFC